MDLRHKTNQFDLCCLSPMTGKGVLQKRRFSQPFQSDHPFRLFREKILLPFFRKMCFTPRIPIRRRGASRSSRVLEWDAVDATLVA
jgi:hypothetical protein